MLRIGLRRAAMAVPILLGVTVIVFLLMTVLPGDPAAAFIGEATSAQEIAKIRDELGLNDPLSVRYAHWLVDAATGDLGYSPYRRRDVTDLLAQAWINTAILAGCSAVLGLVGGVVLGFAAGVRRGRLTDRVISAASLTGLSIPSFFVAILMLILFSAKLGVLPSGGAVLDQGPLVFLRHLLMPMVAGSLATMAITARVTRASIVQTYAADFVQTLRAKGLGTVEILRHVLKNAISPVLTTSGLQIGYLLGGSVLVETIFRWPGMGMLVFSAISARDLLVVQGATLVIALTFVLVNLIVDLLQATIDPRLRRAVA
ncbi:ABC transporter permease [Actinopolymorpha pittospori]|uniref:Peptide/nickel transport system permease protein n=1 Tax=Actinopolymorpha pittospori TaxID=648752 RepID=A0A927RFB5_9ACTN|nr:ABC transporter permease [Actinopolymorpha pittospori]MBE1613174.1 peptide/nickel transport system permease protein [Actinopolymorpha pittospori]